MNTPNSTYKTGFKIPTLKTGKWQIKALYKGGQYPDVSEPLGFAVLPPAPNPAISGGISTEKTAAETSAEKTAAAKDAPTGQAELVAVLETSKGKITCRFFPEVAPNTVMNFVRLAQDGFYTNHIFHRVIKGFMIQGGCPERTGRGGPGYSIPAEFGQKKHLKGTLSMARSQSNDSAGSQFYICLEPQAMLDGKYTVFGETIEGQDVVDAIGNTQTTGNRGNPPDKPAGSPALMPDKPLEDVVIKKITIETR
ncbi:MAG: peptidylprolyl isomerase [Planctomycetes bacterium]|nr:peptidylprolyl isomerase [Planctomycetota bacterium]